MNIVVLLVLMATGLTGALLLATWLGMGGHRAESPHRGRLPNALVFSHVSAAIVVFALWVFFVVLQTNAIAWTAAAFLVVVVALGLGLFRRWLSQFRDPNARSAEHELTVSAVAVHGAFATATALLAVLALARL